MDIIHRAHKHDRTFSTSLLTAVPRTPLKVGGWVPAFKQQTRPG